MSRAWSVMATALVLIAMALVAEGSAALEMTYRFRPGDSWTERFERTVERVTEGGRSVVTDESWTARVMVVSVDARGRARLRRVYADGEAAPVEYHMTRLGEYEPPEEADDSLAASIMNRYAPVVLPTPEDLEGRAVTLTLPGGATFVEVETAVLVSSPGEAGLARLELSRRAGPQAGIARETLVAPGGFRSVPVAKRVEARVDLTGSAGAGEIVFDTAAGRLVSYRMTSTSGLALRVGEVPEPEMRSVIVRIKLEWSE